MDTVASFNQTEDILTLFTFIMTKTTFTRKFNTFFMSTTVYVL